MSGDGDLPPRLDDEVTEERLIFWCGHSSRRHGFGKVLYVGAMESLEQQPGTGEFLGIANGQPNQEYALIHKNAISGTLTLDVVSPDGWCARTR
jgi:hypothetical protein